MIESSTKNMNITVPLSFEAHSLAQKYSKQHNQAKKAKQVYLNTLAVYAVEHYFRCMGFDTDWENCDSRNPLMQKFLDIADLNVKSLGKIECRFVLPNVDVLSIPSEVWEDRIAYVGVQLTQSLKEATLIGFIPDIQQQGIIPLSQLQPLIEFPDYLSAKRQQSLPKTVHLENWFDNIFEAAWQTIEEVFSNKTPNMAYGFRKIASARVDPTDTNKVKSFIKQLYASQGNNSSLEKISLAELEPTTALSQLIQSTNDEEIRWKAIELLWEINPNHPAAGVRRIMDLGMLLGSYPVALMVGAFTKPDGKRGILLRVYPRGSELYLPTGLKLAGLNEAGNSFFEVQARTQDNYIQFKFSADPGDKFTVRVALDDSKVTELFVA